MSRRHWTGAELLRLRALYPDMETKEVAKILGRSAGSVLTQAGKLGLHKSQEHMRRRNEIDAERVRILGARYRFQKGNQVASKGGRATAAKNAHA